MSYSLAIEETCILIRNQHLDPTKCLKISYSFNIEQVSFQDYQKSFTSDNQNNDFKQGNSPTLFHAILGIKIIKDIPFFVVVKQHQIVCSFSECDIYEIKSIDWIPITKNIQKLDNSSEIQQELNSISMIFEEGLHYYSPKYQLFRPYLVNNVEAGSESEKYYDQFIWNDNIIKIDVQSEFMTSFLNFRQNKDALMNYKKQQKVFSKWCTPIIQGYVKLFQTTLKDGFSLRYLLISRRSQKKAGTRFFSRGIDDAGNVANFTQTQQIVFYRDFVMTNIQIRGSVPVFFQQLGVQGINIELNIQRTKQLTKKPFITHFNIIKEHYSRVMCINLLSEHKKSEQKLTNFFQQMIESTNQADVKYKYFDFHEECKSNKFQNTEKLILNIKDIIKTFGFNCYNNLSKQMLKQQSGTFRTNCLDCLDRTNYVQSRISLEILKNMLIEFGTHELQRSVKDQNLLTQSPEFDLNSATLNNFNLLWGQNGDSVSMHYTGIGSTHTDITKVGKRTLFGTVNHKMRSLMRFYTQFTDVKKHETINTFLGNKSLLRFNFSGIQAQKKTYSHNILVISWQFNDPYLSLAQFQKNPYTNLTYQYILSQLKQGLSNKYSLIVLFMYIPNEQINWQSGINFNLKNIINSFTVPMYDAINKWSEFITSELQSNHLKYAFIDANQNENSCAKMMVFCKKNLIENITNIKKDQVTSVVKTKEIVLLTKFKFYESPLVFQGFNVKNINSFGDFLLKANEKGFQQTTLGKAKSTTVSEQSYRLILGNVGSQSKLAQEQYQKLEQSLELYVKDKQKTSKIENLQPSSLSYIAQIISKACQHDQLKKLLESTELMNQRKLKVLANYNEAMLQFIPKNNRILFWNEEGKIIKARNYSKLKQLSYQNTSIFKGEKTKPIFETDKKDKSEAQSCVHLELSYQIQEIL